MVFAHAPIGAMTNKFILHEKGEKHLSLVYLFGILGSIFPDIDTVILLFNEDLNHRAFVTHSSIIYFVVFISALVIFRKHKLLSLLSMAFFLGIASHLVVDFFIGGIAVFVPFDKNVYGFKIDLGATPYTFAKLYITSMYGVYEITAIVLFLFSWSKEKNLIYRHVPIMFTFIAGFMLLLLHLF